jgi:very-short-patch-repair endonuclease
MNDKTYATKKKAAKSKNTLQITDVFTVICKTDLGVECVKEYKFHPVRRWRFDFAIPAYKIAIEVEGGVWTGGRHTSSTGFLKDMEKYNTATSMGWRVFRTTPNDLYKSKTLNMLKNAISGCFSPENDTL